MENNKRLILVDVGVVRLLCLNVLPQQCPGVPPDKDGQILNGRGMSDCDDLPSVSLLKNFLQVL